MLATGVVRSNIIVGSISCWISLDERKVVECGPSRSRRHIMLAHSGLALITEKLQNQRLEEPSQTTCSTAPVTQGSPARTTCQQQAGLTVKGKNVWAISLESERQGRYEFGSQDSGISTPRAPDKIQVSHINICEHKKPRHTCHICDSAPGTPMAPPKKKHCRSLSVPPDSLTIFPAPIRDHNGKIWKPIAVIPQSNNDVQKGKDKILLPTTSTGDSIKWLSRLSSGFKLVPVVPSPPSVDSGHYTTSDLQTPPGSPVPRPASAASDTSFSSQGSVWYDYSPIRSRIRALENRSLSCEDRISTSSSTISMPCVHDSMEPSPGCCGSSSSRDGSNICSSSSIPRCHSQPCVLHHRRCGQKRRRDCDRPTLNFIKMTETAYARSHRRSEPWDSDHQFHMPLHQMFPESLGFGLNPIASSPLDSELPVVARHLMDLTSEASVTLPVTPSDHPSPNSPPQISQQEEEEDEEEEDCNCHGSLTDDGVGFFPVNDLDIEQIENH